MSEEEEYPEDKRHEIWEKVRYDKCRYWSDKYEDCKAAYKLTTDEDATCKGWFFDMWSCIGKHV